MDSAAAAVRHAGGAGVRTAVTQLGGFDASLLQRFDEAAPIAAVLVVALLVGAVHGAAPGHGKSLGAAHLVGPDATVRHAAALAGAVAALHTVSVIVLAIAWWVLAAGRGGGLAAVTRWGQLAVAVAVLAVGVRLTRRRWRAHRAGGHDHDAHGHGAHGHHGAPPWTRAGLLTVAAAGGLLPSPSAFLVLVSGLATGRAGVAVAAVLAFGLGLGATVLCTGLLTISGRDWLQARAAGPGRLRRIAPLVPLLGAAAVAAGGAAAVIVAVRDLPA